jgi:hypothetical protein
MIHCTPRKPRGPGFYWFREAHHRFEHYLVEVVLKDDALVFNCALVGDKAGTCSRYARFGLWKKLTPKEAAQAMLQGCKFGNVKPEAYDR